MTRFHSMCSGSKTVSLKMCFPVVLGADCKYVKIFKCAGKFAKFYVGFERFGSGNTSSIIIINLKKTTMVRDLALLLFYTSYANIPCLSQKNLLPYSSSWSGVQGRHWWLSVETTVCFTSLDHASHGWPENEIFTSSYTGRNNINGSNLMPFHLLTPKI